MAGWFDPFKDVFSVVVGGIGSWLALRSFYEAKHKEAMQRYADSQTKAYAAERDFNHLRNNQEQLKSSMALMDQEVDEVKSDVKEVKALLSVILARSGGSASGFFDKREE